MKIIQAHRKRVATLKNTMEALLRVEMELHDARSESWHIQESYKRGDEPALRQAHEKIEKFGNQVRDLRRVLEYSPEPAMEPGNRETPQKAPSQELVMAG